MMIVSYLLSPVPTVKKCAPCSARLVGAAVAINSQINRTLLRTPRLTIVSVRGQSAIVMEIVASQCGPLNPSYACLFVIRRSLFITLLPLRPWLVFVIVYLFSFL